MIQAKSISRIYFGELKFHCKKYVIYYLFHFFSNITNIAVYQAMTKTSIISFSENKGDYYQTAHLKTEKKIKTAF